MLGYHARCLNKENLISDDKSTQKSLEKSQIVCDLHWLAQITTKDFLEALLNSDSGSEERLPISTEVEGEIDRLENSDWESVDLTKEEGLSGEHVVEWEQQDNDKESYDAVVMKYASVINQLGYP